MPDENRAALTDLRKLLKQPGHLKIITNEVRPSLRVAQKDPRSPAKDGVDLTTPASFVCHDVVDLEGPDDKGRYLARSAEGDWTLGYPTALLARLQQWQEG
jgi:hypothetical protein